MSSLLFRSYIFIKFEITHNNCLISDNLTHIVNDDSSTKETEKNPLPLQKSENPLILYQPLTFTPIAPIFAVKIGNNDNSFNLFCKYPIGFPQHQEEGYLPLYLNHNTPQYNRIAFSR